MESCQQPLLLLKDFVQKAGRLKSVCVIYFDGKGGIILFLEFKKHSNDVFIKDSVSCLWNRLKKECHLHKKGKMNSMQKISFVFPTYDSMWLFKNQTQAINVSVIPKKNIIRGLFPKKDVDLAITQFNAVTVKQ